MSYPKPKTAIHLALGAVVDGGLRCLLMRRLGARKVGDNWTLSSGAVHFVEAIGEIALRRILLAQRTSIRAGKCETTSAFRPAELYTKSNVHGAIMIVRYITMLKGQYTNEVS